MITKCPECGADWDGGSILETFIEQRELGFDIWKGMTDAEIEEQVKEYYRPPYRWGRQIGIELDNDRIEYWQCPDCNIQFKVGDERLKEKSIC